MSASEIKADMKDLYFSAAKEIEVGDGRKAIIIFVPFKLLKFLNFVRKIHQNIFLVFQLIKLPTQ